ncbi:uncharacterized protein LOC125063778 [Pieris napi]|uniref:uncharacterized protein LOC125063778 n=1 Tax=Pieris napi TaxID=78633 RepID=UPI001FBB0E4C|nr:uncharacterized protein LOC125063778 [Pieris napi]
MTYKSFLLILIFDSTLSVDKTEKIIEKLKEEWHVSTLKSTDFNEGICDISNTKQNDASQIEFVSSDPLPFNETDIIQNMCIRNKNVKEKLYHGDKHSTGEKDSIARNSTINKEPTNNNATAEARRVHDYQFSSVEYYDEHPEFDESHCPDDVEIVELELDELRNYDLECELIIEWRSLD